MLDVLKSPELQAAILAIRQARREVQRDIGKAARRELRPVWTEALAGQAETPLEHAALVPGAAVRVSGRQVSLVAAKSNRALSGGLVPNIDGAPVAWGAHPRLQTVQLTSRRGKQYTAKRIKNRQFRPPTKHGYAVGPAAAIAGHRIVAGWVSVVVEAFGRAGKVE